MIKRILCSLSATNTAMWLVGLMFSLPFIMPFHQQPIPSFYPEWIAALLGFAAMFALVRKQAWQPMLIPQIAFIFPGLAAILLMQWMLGMLHSTQYALLFLSYLVWGFMLVVLGAYLRRELGWDKLVTTLAWCLVAAASINASLVLLQYLMRLGVNVPYMPQLSSYGAISQANHFADFTALATASLIYLYAKGRIAIKPFSAMLVLLIAMLSFSGSRSAWLYLAAFTVLAIAMQVVALKQLTGSKAKRSLLRVSLLLLPVFVFVQLFIYYVLPDSLVSLPTERMADAAAASASPRLQIWYDSLRLFMQSPWLGVGAGNMRAETFLLIDSPAQMATKQVFEHGHNLFIHLLAEMGVGGCLIAAVGLMAWVRAFQWRELGLEAWWLVALLAVLGIHSLLEYPLWYAYFLGIAAILLGAGEEKLSQFSLVTLNLAKFNPAQANLAQPALSPVHLAQSDSVQPDSVQSDTAQISASQHVQKTGHWFASLIAYVAFYLVIMLGAVNLGTMLVANIKLEHWLLNFTGDANKMHHEKLDADIDWVHQYSVLSPYAELMYALSMAVNPSYIDDKVWLNQHAMQFKPMRRLAYQRVLLLKLQGNHAGAVKLLNRTLIAHPGDFKGELEALPFKYWQDYLDVLSEARPIVKKDTMQSVQQQKLKALIN